MGGGREGWSGQCRKGLKEMGTERKGRKSSLE